MAEILTIDTLRVAQRRISELPIAAPIVKFVESPHLTITIEDWSEVRSPSRAERRRRQGHPQRIRYQTVPDPKFYRLGDTIAMHPETARKFREQMASRFNDRIESAVLGSIYGGPR